ncbi:hypothetical protein [Streptomyces olivochromogenes]|uniref:hypothetical protein n=1 Tax=Streptomyces olivochromogenes TaxID=1963 RepID=UPI001F347666|nr:hypothetical protein [Streptomyces olivochromogenes]MCF3136767.1 hypothetical protein [Streptomyces olivochromogenes]
MDGYVMSRGRDRGQDYGYLGAAPPAAWWRSYSGVADFEYPTLLVESDAGGWRAYLSGIRSERTDAVGTPLRFTLVLSGGPADETAPQVARFAAQWLEDIAARRPAGAVAACLDRHFPAEDVERLLELRDAAALAETRRRLEETLADPAGPAGGEKTGDGDSGHGTPRSAPPSWINTVQDGLSRKCFAVRVGDLLSGTPGRALLLNLATEAGDVPDAGPDGRVAALVVHPKQDFGPGPVAIPGKVRGLVEAGPAHRTTPGFWRSRSTGQKALIALGAIVLAAAVGAAGHAVGAWNIWDQF